MIRKFSLIALVAGASAVSLQADATIDYSGETNNTNLTTIPWVGTSDMWGTIDTGSAEATGQSGFSLFTTGGFDITKLSWTFGDLDLDEGSAATFSPGPATPGSEKYVYTPGPGNLTVSYEGAEWAYGSITEFITSVDDAFDADASGTGVGILTSYNLVSGDAEDFFTEFMAHSGGTGEFTFAAFNFAAVSPSKFSSDGVWTISGGSPIPEPASTGLLIGLAFMGYVIGVRRSRASR